MTNVFIGGPSQTLFRVVSLKSGRDLRVATDDIAAALAMVYMAEQERLEAPTDRFPEVRWGVTFAQLDEWIAPYPSERYRT
jgi:hypothetical protein